MENFEKNNSSEDGFAEMNRLVPDKGNMSHESTLKQYGEKQAILTAAIIELEAYITAKENIEKVQFEFERLYDGSSHVNHDHLREVAEKLQKYTDAIEKYEQQYHVPDMETLELQKEKLAELKEESDQLRKVQDHYNFDGKSTNYKNN